MPETKPEFRDKTITCQDCRQPFGFSADEQKKYWDLYEQGKFESYNEPKRCISCRMARKNRQQRRRG